MEESKDIEYIPVSDLKLDPDNPRLPEDADVSSQAALMMQFYRDYALDELAASYVANGFFPSEHLLILKDGTVLEGNRRLAALKFLLHDDDAAKAGLSEYSTDMPFSQQDKEKLSQVPVLKVDDRDEIWAYLGYRHISGPKEWSPAAKARFVSKRVDEIAKDDPDDCFKTTGKEVGSNALGVRNDYIHYGLLRMARDEYGLYKQAVYILNNRFGVWARLLNNQAIFGYIGFQPASKTYHEINSAFSDLDKDMLLLLMSDLCPRENEGPLLSDSRQASSYAAIIQNADALSILRQTGDFESALMIAQGSSVLVRLRKVQMLLETVDNDLDNGISIEEESLELCKKLRRVLAGIEAKAEELLEEEVIAQEPVDDN